MIDYGAEAQRRAEEHLEACEVALEDDTSSSPASAPFCGCSTCVIRETLYAAWPLLELAARAELGDAFAFAAVQP